MNPILIVAFARHENVIKIARYSQQQNRRIYIFVDGPNDLHAEAQQKTRSVAEDLAQSPDITIHCNPKNLGVAEAVPAAIDWCFQYEDSAIILEDDCIPLPGAYDYFDWGINELGGNTQIVSGVAPESFAGVENNRQSSTLSIYPLIWGWGCTKLGWSLLRRTKRDGYSFSRCIKSIYSRPSRAKSVAFFLAAAIRVSRGNLKAWDSEIALEMLVSGYKAIIPNRSVITNTGNDEFASHQMGEQFFGAFVENDSNPSPPSFQLSKNIKLEVLTNHVIEKYIFGMKFRQILSPFKALLENRKKQSFS